MAVDNITVLWDATSYSLEKIQRRFGGLLPPLSREKNVGKFLEDPTVILRYRHAKRNQH
jgi:hypothetical protein